MKSIFRPIPWVSMQDVEHLDLDPDPWTFQPKNPDLGQLYPHMKIETIFDCFTQFEDLLSFTYVNECKQRALK